MHEHEHEETDGPLLPQAEVGPLWPQLLLAFSLPFLLHWCTACGPTVPAERACPGAAGEGAAFGSDECGLPSCSVDRRPGCTGREASLVCDRPVSDPLTQDCKNLNGPRPCAVGLGATWCRVPDGGDGSAWCCE